MISIFTPVHAKAMPFVRETYESLKAQTVTNWEWVTVTNGGGFIPEDIAADPRVKVFAIADDDSAHNRIGRLKGAACAFATGDILVELDADDILVPTALEEIELAFVDPQIAMAYSNSAEFQDGTWEGRAYGEQHGWQTRPFTYEGHDLIEMVAWPVSSQMMRFIFWAPNHVRAWRTEAYRAIGGHDASIKTGDDHDLCCRTYLAYGQQGFKHIDKCLYVYRLHEQNSCTTNNSEVQEQTLRNYLKYSRDMAVRWSNDNGFGLADLGGAHCEWPAFGQLPPGIDLNLPWPIADNSVGVLRASFVFNRLIDPIHAMNEAYRVLAPGGWLFLDMPSTDGRGAFQDPRSKSFWNENSAHYYTNSAYAHQIPEFTGRFQNSRTVTFFPTELDRVNNTPVVQMDFIAVKGEYAERPVGEVLI